MAKWLLLDGYNLAFRCFYGLPEMTRSDGFPTNAIVGWVRTLWLLQDKEKPDRQIMFFDLGRSEERMALHPEYKANRAETPPNLKAQVPWLKKITSAMGIPIIERQGVEADDLIAAAALKLNSEGHDVYIVSSDKDLAQILKPGITQLLPPPTANPKAGWRVLDAKGVIEKFGVTTEQIVDYLALIGDSSDNIPGVPGVGPKTAVKWIKEYGSIEKIIEKANYISPPRFQSILPKYKDLLNKNKEMIKLKDKLDVGMLEKEDAKPKELINILEEMEMQKAVKDAQERFGVKE